MVLRKNNSDGAIPNTCVPYRSTWPEIAANWKHKLYCGISIGSVRRLRGSLFVLGTKNLRHLLEESVAAVVTDHTFISFRTKIAG